MPHRLLAAISIVASVVAISLAAVAQTAPDGWRSAWPRTDFSRAGVPFGEIVSGGPPKDGIPAIDDPRFAADPAAAGLAPTEPVVGLEIAGDARAYPLRILIWHEIVNDVVGGVPVAVTYCPLCNSAVVYDRRVDGRTLDFGVSGMLRHSDLVMYDRQSESWWQQFVGRGIVGRYTGTKLTALPARLESFARFRARFPTGKVLVPTHPGARRYGANPYAGYDSSAWPFLYRGAFGDPIAPLARVVVVGDEAWPLDLLKAKGEIRRGDLVLTWTEGQNSALDAPQIDRGFDVGNVTVERLTANGRVDAVYDLALAFAFRAFHPKGTLHTQ